MTSSALKSIPAYINDMTKIVDRPIRRRIESGRENNPTGDTG
ncbi:MAG: hypothetical protein ACO3XI_17755 [bacterium]